MANNNTPVKTDKKEEIKKDNQKAEAKTEAKAEKAADDEEIDSEELFKRRVSIDMTTENSWFSASAGGLISLKIINAEGAEEFFRGPGVDPQDDLLAFLCIDDLHRRVAAPGNRFMDDRDGRCGNSRGVCL